VATDTELRDDVKAVLSKLELPEDKREKVAAALTEYIADRVASEVDRARKQNRSSLGRAGRLPAQPPS
jgi:hypothetical protein